MRFRDYVKSDYTEAKDAMSIECDTLRQSNAPCIMYGTGFRAKKLTEYLSAKEIKLDAYSESSQFYYDGKKFMGREVVDIAKLQKHYAGCNLIIGCSGASMADKIPTFLSDKSIRKVFFFEKFMIPCEITYDWIMEHLYELDNTFESLEDDESKTVFLSFIYSHIPCLKIPPGCGNYAIVNSILTNSIISMIFPNTH